MNVGTLIKKLTALAEPLGDKGLELEVKGWLPGSTLSVGSPFAYKDHVRIELNVDPGSAIERMMKIY